MGKMFHPPIIEEVGTARSCWAIWLICASAVWMLSGCSRNAPVAMATLAAPAVGPRLVLPRCAPYLGAGVPGDLLKTSIPLFNSGDRDLHIRSITASCGCAGVELSRKTIPPGESGQLTISARLRNDHERVSFEIQFQDDDPTSPHALWASADTLPILRTDVH